MAEHGNLISVTFRQMYVKIYSDDRNMSYMFGDLMP